jgi:hypothetical protein
MLGLVLPTSKSVLLKTFTIENCKEIYNIRDNKEAVISFLDNFFLTSNLNILEKFYCLLHIRDLCIGNIIELRDYGFDISQIQDELVEIDNIKKVINFNNNSITLNYPKAFPVTTLYEGNFIETIILDDETIDFCNLNSTDQALILNYLPLEIKTEVTKFYKKHISKLEINFTLKGDTINLNLHDSFIVSFLATILSPIDNNAFRDYIFILSERMHDITFLQNCTFLDIKDYMELYVKENKERNDEVKNKS